MYTFSADCRCQVLCYKNAEDQFKIKIVCHGYGSYISIVLMVLTLPLLLSRDTHHELEEMPKLMVEADMILQEVSTRALFHHKSSCPDYPFLFARIIAKKSIASYIYHCLGTIRAVESVDNII